MKYTILAVLFLVCFMTAGLGRAVAKEELSDGDRARIIQLALELTLKAKRAKPFPKKTIFSTVNLTPKLLPRIPGYEFRLMNPSAIEKKEKIDGRIRFLQFEHVGLSSDSTKENPAVGVRLFIVERSGGLPLYSHRYSFRFVKTDGKWQGYITIIVC